MAATGPHNAGTSQSWISPAASTAARYARISTSASHLGLARTSPFFPQNATEYAVHVQEAHDARLRRQRMRMQGRIAELGFKKRGGRPLTRGEDLRIRKFAFASFHLGRTVPAHEQRLEDGGSASYSKVLGEKTAVWGGDEEKIVEGKKSETSLKMRAFWPDMAELKAEGEGRIRNGEPRRLPLPRIDLYSDAVVRRLIPDSHDLSSAEIDVLCAALAAKRDDIVWFERRAVSFHGTLDRLPTASKIFEEHEEMERYVARERTDSGVSTSFESDPAVLMTEGRTVSEQDYYGGQILAPPGFRAAPGRKAAGDLPSYLSALALNSAPPPRPIALPPPRFEPTTGMIAGHVCYATDYASLAPLGGWKFDEQAMREEGWSSLLDELYCTDENFHAAR